MYVNELIQVLDHFENPFNYLQSLVGVSSFTSQCHPLLQFLVPHLTLPVFDLPYRCKIALGSLGETVRRDFHRGGEPAWERLGKQRGGFYWQTMRRLMKHSASSYSRAEILYL